MEKVGIILCSIVLVIMIALMVGIIFVGMVYTNEIGNLQSCICCGVSTFLLLDFIKMLANAIQLLK